MNESMTREILLRVEGPRTMIADEGLQSSVKIQMLLH